MKLRSSWLDVASTMRSIHGRGKLSFGHVRLMSVKSMQSHHLSFTFLTSTMLANHSGYSTSLIALAWRSFPTSSFITFCLSEAKLLFCLTVSDYCGVNPSHVLLLPRKDILVMFQGVNKGMFEVFY